MEKLKEAWSRCNECKRNTHQTVMAEHRFDQDPDSYRCTIFYQVIRCDGCHYISYRTENHDVESGYECEYRGWTVPMRAQCYPRMELENKLARSQLPVEIDEIFSETLSAFNEGANTLTGLGLRATIEAICNEKGITGKNLQVRINKLATAGLISKNDTKRLHAIRFLGNDAAHKLVKPKSKSIAVAKTIIEHLITTIYLLDTEMASNLVTVIDEYAEFEILLREKTDLIDAGEELSIPAIVGEDMRRLDANYPFNEELSKRIATGECSYLKMGKKEKMNNSKDKIQHYIVHKEVDQADAQT